MKYLFVCLANMDRSVTAEKVCREMAQERGIEIKVESAGLDVEGGRQLTKEIAKSADRIFVMEGYMIKRVVEEYGQPVDKLCSLNIPDIYKRDDPELVQSLKEKLESLAF